MGSKKNMLIITPYSEYGDLICRSLSKIVSGNMKTVSTMHAVAKYFDNLSETNSSIDYVLLDLEFGIEKTRKCVFYIRDINPSVEIIMVSKNDPSEEVDDLRPWSLLKKPFIENDLLEIITRTINHQKVSVIDGKFLDVDDLRLPMWARNKESLISIMTDTLKDLDAQEAILISADNIIASAGNLKALELDGCSKILNKYMDFSGHGEIIKQVRISENEYLLHALNLTVGLIIALLFDPETSYEIIRSQTRQVAGRITHPALNDHDPHPKEIPYFTVKTDPIDVSTLRNSENDPKYSNLRNCEDPAKTDIQDKNVGFGQKLNNVQDDRYSGGSPNANSILDESLIEERNKNRKKRPSIISVGMSQLPFTCLLIPRLDPKSLSDELVEFLKEKTPLIFLSYGWRLNDILIKKEMMQWIAAIPPIIAPAFQIKTIRRETTKLIFENFPRISMNGLMKDFWAPGYLVSIGSERISDYEISGLIYENQQRYLIEDPNTSTNYTQKVLYNY